MAKTILAAQNKQQRQRERKTLGTLGQLIVSDKTRARYYSSVQLFFKWVETEGVSLPNEVHLVDELLSNYIEHF